MGAPKSLRDRQRLTGPRRIEYVQDRIKAICKEHRIPEINPGPSDGQHGPRTDFAIGRMKMCFGTQRKHRNARTDNGFIAHLYDPFDRRNFKAKGQWKRALAYRQDLRRLHSKRLKDRERALRAGGVGAGALRAASRQVGKVETGNNSAPWLTAIENDIPHNRIDWMIPGNPYCGLGVIWSYWVGARLLLPDGCVYTPNIRTYAGKTIGRAHFTLVSPERAKPGALVVFDWNPGTGADHVALARGPMRGGQIPTIEFNTSPTNAGSQSNGGGVWKRVRTRGLIQCVLNVNRA